MTATEARAGTSITLTPDAKAVEHSLRRRECHARCVATRDDEHAAPPGAESARVSSSRRVRLYRHAVKTIYNATHLQRVS